MDRAALQDKLLGMILLGAYADALGAPHEHAGLRGESGDPGTARRLARVSAYHPPEQEGDEWWVWADGSDFGPDAIGAPTDDASYRLVILEEWLGDRGGPARLSEEALLAWMRDQLKLPLDAAAPTWRRRRRAQIQSWIAMMEDAGAWRRALQAVGGDAARAREAWSPSSLNRFYRPGVPVVFGMFLYAELGALRAGCACAEVVREFSSFCRLDEGQASVATGLFAALIAEAVTAPDELEGFNEWLRSRAASLSEDAPRGHRVITRALSDGEIIGVASRGLRGEDFTRTLREQIYLPRVRAIDHALANFDPALFVAMIAAASAYAEDDPLLALRVLARSPGDADTLPSLFGLIVGARAGAVTLARRSAELNGDLTLMRRTIEGLFGVDLDQRAARLAELASRFGCLALEDR